MNNLDSMWEPDRPNSPITFEQDELYLRTKTSYPNGVAWTRKYNKAGQLLTDYATRQGDTANPLMDLTYSYASGDKVTSLVQTVTDNVSNPRVITTYTYDKLNRLERSLVKEQGGTQPVWDEYNYTYDKNSNMLTRRRGGGELRKYVYNQADQLTCSYATAANDCPASDPTNFTMGYDLNGNATSINSGAGNASYTATGSTDHWTQHTVPSGPTTGMNYFDDDQTERTVKGSTSYSYDLLGLATERTNGIRTHFTKDDEAKYLGMRVATDSSNNTFNHYYYLTDHLGSVMAVTNDNGNKIGDVAGDNSNNNGLYTYDPYGQQLHNPLSGSGVNNPIRWASGYFDPEFGFYKFGTRHYMPNYAGRWTQPDPARGQISDPTSLNSYLYVGSNPINNTDTTGEFWTETIFAGLVGLASMVGLDVLGAPSLLVSAGGGCGAAVAGGYVAAIPTGGLSLAAAAGLCAIGGGFAALGDLLT